MILYIQQLINCLIIDMTNRRIYQVLFLMSFMYFIMWLLSKRKYRTYVRPQAIILKDFMNRMYGTVQYGTVQNLKNKYPPVFLRQS